MPLLIKKTVKLDFLGEEYKDAYIVFKSVPVKDFEIIAKEQEEIGDDNSKALHFIIDNLKKYFISGKAPNESGELVDLVKDDVEDLDQQSVIKCFELLTGQNVNEESDFLEPASSKPSSTVADSPSKS